MEDELIRAISALAHRLVTLAERDGDIRVELRALAEAVLTATERPAHEAPSESVCLIVHEAASVVPAPEPIPPSEGIETPGPAVPETISVDPIRTSLPLPELILGRSRPPVAGSSPEPTPLTSRAATTDAEQPVIEARCRLKAEGVRWAATRRRRMHEGAEFRVEIAPRDREILDRAKNLECFLWMCTPDFSVPKEPTSLEVVAGCFEAVADALGLVRGMLPDVEANREFFEPALDLLAEAQSALRVAIDRIEGPRDPDQFRVYDWLRGMAAREQIFIPRHMRLGDPADPAHLPDIEDRIEDMDARFQGVRQRAKKRKSHLNRLRYHAKLIGEGTGGEHDWRKVAEAIGEMVEEGVPASNAEVREAALPILDDIPDLDDLPQGFGLVLREIDRYLAGRMSPREPMTAEVPTPEVSEAARLLSGKGMVLIGGSRRPEAYEALKTAFGLEELVWVETREHESIDRFEPYVARPEVALVLLAIRWTSHSFGDVKRFCDRYDKPMVRLPGGYSPNQVAAQILVQCSEQLGVA